MNPPDQKESTIGDTILLLVIVLLLALIGNMLIGCADVPMYDPDSFCAAECHISGEHGTIRVDTPGGLYTCDCKDLR